MQHVKYVLLAAVSSLSFFAAAPLDADERPNILWITSEDNGPHLGCYGDEYAVTPNIDALAGRGLRYNICWSNAPVCAPARTTLISGLYPPCTGAEHMRSMTRLPAGFRMYPQYLREAGYYCTNNSKEDYNLEKPGKVWDESSRQAHWKNRKAGQPFFAIFNYTISHESQIRNKLPEKNRIHDRKQVRVPAYHPDTPEVRDNWAQYYDRITMMDALVGRSLKELEEAGLADDTIVFYYGDHGSGMPRSKRWPYNSGLHVPLIVSVPAKFQQLRPADYQTGGNTDRLVSFVDLAPTLLSLAGVKPPAHFQGHAFMGQYEAPPQPYIYGFRGRMDERYDMVRSVRDQRYIYIRNYMPHKIYGQYVSYMFQTQTTQVWKRLYDEGKLSPAQTHFWETKPTEELYDLETDPDEVHNLAGSPEHREILQRLRKAHREHVLAIRDVGFLPEGEIHSRSAGSTPYEMGHDGSKYPLERILKMAELASSGNRGGKSDAKSGGNGDAKSDAASDLTARLALIAGLSDDDSAVRYWAATGLFARAGSGFASVRDPLRRALKDTSPSVRVIAAQALAQHGDEQDLEQALPILTESADFTNHGVYVSVLALNALDELDGKAASVRDTIAGLPKPDASVTPRMRSYAGRLIQKTLADLDAGGGKE